MNLHLRIEPRDPVMLRDGRPFSAGMAARSLSFPQPSTTVGMVRMLLGQKSEFSDIPALLRVAQTGPFLLYRDDLETEWKLALPAPADAVGYDLSETAASDDPMELVHLTPAPPEAGEGVYGTDLPAQFLFGARENKASKRLPDFWNWTFYSQWLTRTASKRPVPDDIGPPAMARHRRMHVAIDKQRQSASEGMLYSTDSLEFWAGNELDCRSKRRLTRFAVGATFKVPESILDSQLPAIGFLGGERRFSMLNTTPVACSPAVPEEIGKATRVRLILVTPGLFQDGWRPAWLGSGWTAVPGCPGLELRLVGAAVPRSLPISGWDLAARGPKATRLMAPAGSVYFCEARGDASALWMQSLSDIDAQASRDGFGIVTLGVW